MKNLSNQSYYKQSAENVSGGLVKAVLETNLSGVVKTVELVKSIASDRGSDSRVAAWTFSSADHSAVINSHAAHLVGMNGAAVVPAGRLSGEGVNFGAGNSMNHIHSEAGINFTDFMPANFEALQRVNDEQALGVENYLGMNKDQIEDCANYQTPSNRANSISKAVINNVDVDQSANCKKGAESHGISTAGAEGLAIGKLIAHPAILSCVYSTLEKNSESAKERRAA